MDHKSKRLLSLILSFLFLVLVSACSDFRSFAESANATLTAAARPPVSTNTPAPAPNGNIQATATPSASTNPTEAVINPNVTLSANPNSVLPNVPGSTQIDLLFPAYSDKFVAQISAQLDQFRKTYPTIQTTANFIPEADLRDRIASAYASGVLPTMSMANYNDLAIYQDQSEIMPFDSFPSTYWDRFVKDSSGSVLLNQHFYGVPWFRDSCSPAYNSLILFKGSPDQILAAHLLAEYLTGSDVQRDNLMNLDLFPTLSELYDKGVVVCPVQETMHVQSNLANAVVQASLVSEDTLSGLEQKFNSYASTALLPDAAIQPPPSFVTRIILIPAAGLDQHYNDNLVFGAVQIDDPDVATLFNVQPGAYMLVCPPEPDGRDCELVNPGKIGIPFTPLSYTKQDFTVTVPGVSIEQNPLQGCFYLDGLKLCLTIAPAS